jgi:hypothetical protein
LLIRPIKLVIVAILDWERWDRWCGFRREWKRDFRSGEFVCLRCTMRIQKDMCVWERKRNATLTAISIYTKRETDGRTNGSLFCVWGVNRHFTRYLCTVYELVQKWVGSQVTCWRL